MRHLPALILFIGLLVGFTFGQFWTGTKGRNIIILISDDSNCSVIDYAIETKYKTITVSKDQINNHLQKPLNANVSIDLYPPLLNSGENFTYKVHANYSNCKNLVSSERIVEKGWILYEFIKNGKIEHVVRAR